MRPPFSAQMASLNSNLTIPHPRHKRATGQPGFALVVTLTLMILLTLLAVGLLSLSSVALRQTAASAHSAAARSNARLALMLAIGELQKELGPDRRISASAAILDEKPETEQIDGVAEPHFLGVWKSWDTWLTDKKDSLTIQDTYKRGRDPSLFRCWLASHPNSKDYETALTSAPLADRVTLVGVKSAGNDSANHVKVPRVPLQSGSSKGSYAWWVADESQKIRLDLKNRAETTPSSAQTISGHTGRPGIESLADMQAYDTTDLALDKMITTGEAAIQSPKVVDHFHNLTAYSSGLLTDVRAGGFKSDLNQAFETSSTPAEMTTVNLFGGRTFDAPIRPLGVELGKIKPKNPYVAPVSWRQMREYYRLYRSFDAKMQPVKWAGSTPETRRFMMGRKVYPHIADEPDTKGYARQLVLVRQSWILATRTQNKATPTGGNAKDYFIVAVPVVYWWNPYNITMKVGSSEVLSVATLDLTTTVQCQVYRGTNRVGGPQTLLMNGGYVGYSVSPTEVGNKDIVFGPGEVRAFSVNEAIVSGGGQMNSLLFKATPGYEPLRNTPATRGLQYPIYVGPDSSDEPTFALRIDKGQRYSDHRFWGSADGSVNVGIWQTNTATHGSVDEAGTPMKGTNSALGCTIGGYSVDWLTPAESLSASIIADQAATRARWDLGSTQPTPVAILSMVAKSAEQLPFENGSAAYAKDYRNRTWLHAPPTALACYLMNPTDLSRAQSPYQIHFRAVNGDQEVSQYIQVNGKSGYFGGGHTAATGQTRLTMLSLPSAPVTSLASFAGMRIDHARAQIMQHNDRDSPRPNDPFASSSFYPMYNLKHISHVGAAFGAGIGNSYAHPMIAPNETYTRTAMGMDPGNSYGNGAMSTNLEAFDDNWDHLFLANEGLWDSWTCSGIAPEMTNDKVTTTKREVARRFFAGEPTTLSRHFAPNLQGKSATELANLAETPTGYRTLTSYLTNNGQFNVNSSSKDAWKTLLLSLRDRPLSYLDANGSNPAVLRDSATVNLARFPLTNNPVAGNGPQDDTSWCGTSTLTDPEIDKLAEQVVRQVKLRGPFLNLTEFINRRLSTDDLGVTGALQAAIDWDEFDASYRGTGGGINSINGKYKNGAQMITTTPATYPNPKAALGSRFAGIPGYVMQSDILQGLSSSITVRGDTFLVRAYGESLLADGTTAARAWCEAVVQRLPDYIVPTDAANKYLKLSDGSPAPKPALSTLNQSFGRRFQTVSFRWLSPAEI
jgi:hypothetical protein